MSNYERNNTMIIFIILVLALGTFALGTAAWISTLPDVSNPIEPNNLWSAENYTFFYFERNITSSIYPFNVVVDSSSIDIDVDFIDNPEILYRIEMRVHNISLARAGTPVLYDDGTHVSMDYPDGDIWITLGNASVYNFDMYTSSGDINIEFDSSGTVSHIKLNTESGDIEIIMDEDFEFQGHISFELEAASGDIELDIALPEGIGGYFYGVTSSGFIDITTSRWNDVESNCYRTPDYSTAAETLTITSITASGDIIAVLS